MVQKQMDNLMDVIRERGAMEKLISDKAQSQISNATKDILRHLVIEQWTSEPHHQNQNPFERQYATIKRMVNNIMNRTGAPAYCWLLCLLYVCFLLNRLAHDHLGNLTPLQYLTGQVPDVSALMHFHFYEPV